MSAMNTGLENFKEIAGLIGTGVSVFVLLSVAGANIVVLISVARIFDGVRRGEHFLEEDLNILLSQRGFLGRRLRLLFTILSRSWHMYPLGILFGLGFDTATEIGLLGISASQSSQGLDLWLVLIFPALFTAGMSLIDTTDGVLMVGAYGWAFVKPIRKLYYNMTITLVSVIVAVVIGGIEALGLIGDKLGLAGGFWEGIGALNDNFNNLGFAIIGVFVVAWVASYTIYKAKGLDEVDVRIA